MLFRSQAGGREGCGMRGEPVAAEAGMMLHQPEAHHVLSPVSCPWITGAWQWRAAQAPGRGDVESDLCLHTGFLVAAAVALASHALLWSSFRRCSESPFLKHPETMVSCLLGSSRLFPGLPPSSLWCTSPLQAVFTPPTPVLSLGSDRSPSLSSQPPPTPAGEQTSLSGW